MKRTREERSTALEAKAKKLVEELMRWSEETDRPNLTQIEDEILKLWQVMSEAMLETVIEDQESQRLVPGPACPKCRKEMQHKGGKLRQVTSRVGSSQLERGYYYCSHCKESIFPLDQQLKVTEKHWSEGVSKLTTWLCGQVSFEDAAEILEQVGGIHLSDSTALRKTQKWGKKLKDQEANQAQAAQQKPVETTTKVSKERLGAAADGVIMYVREEDTFCQEGKQAQGE